MCFIQNGKCDVGEKGRGRRVISEVLSKQMFMMCLFFSMMFIGCEAKLNLAGVQKEQSKNSVRTDFYQKAVTVNGTVVVVGSQGVVLISEDKGSSWQRHVVPGKPNFIGLTLCGDKSLVALSFDRKIWKSGDNGKSWISTPITTKEDVLDVHCAPDGTYWVTGSRSTLLHSKDGGSSWQSMDLGEDAMITYIKFWDADTGYLAGEFGMFYKTIDGGNSWQSVGVIGEELYPLAVYFTDPNTGWAGGLGGVIMKTSDGGVTWSRQESEIPAPVYGFFGDEKQLYGLADGCSVLALKDEKWRRLKTPTAPVYLSAGLVLGEKQLLVAGGWGMLLTLPIGQGS